MTTIKNNGRNRLGFNYVNGRNEVVHVGLLPGLTLNVPEESYEAIRRNPIFQARVRQGTLSVINYKPVVEGEEEGLKLADIRSEEGVEEELVVHEHEDVVSKTNKPYVPTKDLLKSFNGVGESTANKILDLMPSGGWSSKKAFKEATAHFDIEWTPDNKKARNR